MITVRSITAGDWRDYRNMRLRALRDSPDAFGSTYAAEAVRTDDAWKSRIAEAIAREKAGFYSPLISKKYADWSGASCRLQIPKQPIYFKCG